MQTVTTLPGRGFMSSLVSPETAASTSGSNRGLSRHFTRISAAAHSLCEDRGRASVTLRHESHCDEPVKAFTLIALGLAIAAMGIYVAEADDAPSRATVVGHQILPDRLTWFT